MQSNKTTNQVEADTIIGHVHCFARFGAFVFGFSLIENLCKILDVLRLGWIRERKKK